MLFGYIVCKHKQRPWNFPEKSSGLCCLWKIPRIPGELDMISRVMFSILERQRGEKAGHFTSAITTGVVKETKMAVLTFGRHDDALKQRDPWCLVRIQENLQFMHKQVMLLFQPVPRFNHDPPETTSPDHACHIRQCEACLERLAAGDICKLEDPLNNRRLAGGCQGRRFGTS